MQNEQVEYPKYLGSTASPKTLTAVYSGNQGTGIMSRFLHNGVISGNYIPAATNSTLQLYLQGSNDGGATWRPIAIVNENTAPQISVYAEGVEYTLPADGTSTTSTAIPFSVQFTVVFDQIRIAAKGNDNRCIWYG